MKIEWIQKDKHRMTPHPPLRRRPLPQGRGEQRQQQVIARACA